MLLQSIIVLSLPTFLFLRFSFDGFHYSSLVVLTLSPVRIEMETVSHLIFYLQLVWGETSQVGCGYTFYYDPARGYTKLYVCNYGPGGNVIGSNPYEKGRPSCSAYGLADSRKYSGLCCKYTIRKLLCFPCCSLFKLSTLCCHWCLSFQYCIYLVILWLLPIEVKTRLFIGLLTRFNHYNKWSIIAKFIWGNLGNLCIDSNMGFLV